MNNRSRRRLGPDLRRSFGFLSVLAAVGLGACTIVTAPPPASGSSSAAGSSAHARYEDNTYRPGGDLRSFELPQGGPEACAAACEQEAGCYAYSYTKPSHASHGVGQCALKHNIPMASKSPCCVSGVIRPWP